MLIGTTTNVLSPLNPPVLNAIGCSIERKFSAPNLDIPGTFFHTGPQFAYRIPRGANVIHTSSIEFFCATLVMLISKFKAS